jgi:MFS family permease
MQMSIYWVLKLISQAADRYGRKPCLVVSLFGITIGTCLFGMSKTLWQMVLFRCLSGVFAGTLLWVTPALEQIYRKSANVS